MIRRIIVIVFVLLFSIPFFAADFKKVDKYARSIKKTGDYNQLAVKLTSPFENESEKVRAIFVWITYNIKYDYRKFKNNQSNRNRFRIKGRSKKEIELKRKKLREKKTKSAYRKGKGVCEDYSYLFLFMCQSVGIEAKYITGVSKQNARQIGTFPKRSSHAWNAVKIDGKWHLLDATWAAGIVNQKTGRFTRVFYEGFYLIEPKFFILSHFPDDEKWQLLEHPISKKEFSNFAYLHGVFYKDKNILEISPKKGFLNAIKKFSLVKIKYKDEMPNIVRYSKGKMKKLEFINTDNEMIIKIPTQGKFYRSVVLGIKEGRRFEPLLEYKIR